MKAVAAILSKAVLAGTGWALAAGVALAVTTAVVGSTPSWAGMAIGAGAATLVIGLGVAELAAGDEQITAVGLPGFRPVRALPGPRLLRSGAGLWVAGLIVIGRVAPLWVTVVLLATGSFLTVAVLARIRGLNRRRRRAQRELAAAVEAHAPKFVIYTGRRNDATYQINMWVPLLQKLDVPYVVIVRDAGAAKLAARVTDAPVISCPTASDLDAAVVDSIKAAFYVNMIAENMSFVLYRGMTHVYLGHGDSDKELSAHPAHAMFDQIFVAGPAARERYPRNGVLIPDEKFVVIGRPQLSGVQIVDLPIGRTPVPTVLVAPTWRGYNSRTTLSSMRSAPALVDGLIAHGAAVVFRPHPFSWQGHADRAHITAVDEKLRADRAASGRRHVLASEQRDRSVADLFDLSDALVTDVGSLLVDYFVTGKPYAVVLPPEFTPGPARHRFPTLEAAYLVTAQMLAQPESTTSRWFDDLLGSDPLADRRPEVTRHYLGDRPGEDGPFLAAARSVLTRS